MANRYLASIYRRNASLMFTVLLMLLPAFLIGCGKAAESPAGSIETEMWKPCWSKDGKALYYGKAGQKYGTSEVWRYDIKTKTKKKLHDLPYEVGDIDISPDGKWIVFNEILDKKPIWCIDTFCLSTGKLKRVYETKNDLNVAHWLPQNRIVFWEGSADEVGALVMVTPDRVAKINTVAPIYYSKDGDGFVSFNSDEGSYFYRSFYSRKDVSLGVRDVSQVFYLSRRQMIYYNYAGKVVSVDIKTARKTYINLPKTSAFSEISPDLRHYYYIPMSRGEWGPLPGLHVMNIPASERVKLTNIENQKPSGLPVGKVNN